MSTDSGVPQRKASRKDVATAKVSDDIAVKRTRPEARDEPFKRKNVGKSSSSLRSGRDIQDALINSSSALSLDAFPDEEEVPSIPVETQIANLDSFQPEGQAELSFYNETSSQAGIYRQIFLQARRLNYNISDLEVVLVGLRNQGKSSLLQAVLGIPISIGRTRRAFYYHLVNDPSISTPRYIIKEQSKEIECTLEELHKELSKRNRARIEPVTLLIEYKWGFDLTIIDTPAIRSLEEMAAWARPAMTGTSNRFLVAVESAKLSKDIQVYHWLKHFDPSFSRSTLVLTGFDSFLQGFQHRPRSTLHHFQEMSSVPCYWMTLPTSEVTADCNLDSNNFKKRVWQYQKSDTETLRLMDLDYSGNTARLGVYNFRKSLDALFQMDLHRHIPSLSRSFQSSILNLEKSMVHDKQKIDNWTVDNIRSYATLYTAEWLKQMELLIRGSVVGEPSKNGQTLQEEHAEYAIWDSKFGCNESESAGLAALTDHNAVSQSNLRLYGAPQLLRLLEEFRDTASKLQMPKIESTEFVGVLDTAWAASEIAQRKIEEQFVPLLESLVNRAFFIMRRMTSICDSVTESAIASSRSSIPVTQKLFPSFSTYLRQSYSSAQNRALQLCHAKSKEEFCSALTIYWELTGGIDPLDSARNSQARQKTLSTVSHNIYDKIKERLIEAFVLNVQTFFLTPASTLTFTKSVAADVATLSEETIKHMFLLTQLKSTYQNQMDATKVELEELKSFQTTFTQQLVPQLQKP